MQQSHSICIKSDILVTEMWEIQELHIQLQYSEFYDSIHIYSRKNATNLLTHLLN